MLRISAGALQPGMIAAVDVYKADGQHIVGAGAALRNDNISKMAEWGIRSLYVQNPFSEDLEILDIVDEKTRLDLMIFLNSTLQSFNKTQILDLQTLKQLIKELISEVILNRERVVQTLEIRTYADYIYGHSVNVCILSILLGISLEYNQEKLSELALGSLLHDLGMTQLPIELLTKPEGLSPEELEITKTHPETAFSILRKVIGISFPTAHIAYQHQERFDGKGYPRNLAGQDILEYARVVSVVDIFDALLADRPYRRGLAYHEACEVMKTVAGSFVEGDFVNLLLSHVAMYPVGTTVQLSSGEFALVKKVTPKNQSRPLVTLLTDTSGRPLTKTTELDLSSYKKTTIGRVLQGVDVFKLFSEMTAQRRL